MGQSEVEWGTPYMLLKSTKYLVKLLKYFLMKIFPTSYSPLLIYDLENSPYFYIIVLILLNHYNLFIFFRFTRLSFIKRFLQCLEQVQAYVETRIKLKYVADYFIILNIYLICLLQLFVNTLVDYWNLKQNYTFLY